MFPQRGPSRGPFPNFHRGVRPPPPPPPPMQPHAAPPAPLQISVTVSPQQLDQLIGRPGHQHNNNEAMAGNYAHGLGAHSDYPYSHAAYQGRGCGNNYNTTGATNYPDNGRAPIYADCAPPHPSEPQYNRFSRQAGHPPPYQNAHYHQRDHGRYDQPPPYSESPGDRTLCPPLLAQPPEFSRENVLAHYPPELQNRSRTREKWSTENGRGRRGGGRVLRGSHSISNLSDGLPLGSEAASFDKGKGKYRKNNDRRQNGEEEDDDNISLKSMPVRGKGQANRFARGGRRGFRGAGRRGGESFRGNSKKSQGYCWEGTVGDEKESEDNDDDDDTASMQSMPTKGVHHHKNKYGKNSGAGKDSFRGGRGGNPRGMGKRGGKSNEDSSKLAKGAQSFGVMVDDDEEEEEKDGSNDDAVSVSSGPTKGVQQQKKKRIGKNSGAHDGHISHGVGAMNKGPSRGGRGGMQRGMGKRGGCSQSGKSEKDQNSSTTPSTDKESKSENSTKTLEVSIYMKTLFENASQLKKCVTEALTFPKKGKYRLQFLSEMLLFKEKASNCKILIISNNLWLAKKSVKTMVESLRKKLKTFVKYSFDGTKATKSAGADGENAPNHRKLEAEGANKEGEINESRNVSNANTTDVQKQKTEQTPPMCSVSVRLSVEKPFAKPGGFITFVTTLVNEYSSIENVSIKDGSVLLEDKLSHCIVDLQSKADAKRLRKSLAKFQKETEVVFSLETLQSDKSTHQDEASLKNWITRIDHVLREMEVKKEAMLVKHQDKVSALRKRLENGGDLMAGTEKEGIEEANVIQDKMIEACRQKEEFLSFCHSLLKKIQDLRKTNGTFQVLNKLQHDFGVECQRFANALPIYARREDIKDLVRSNQVSIILGETGSGKSTQIAPFLHQAELASSGMIVCTQPRKVAAVQLAERVAQEMAVNSGDLVGYKVGNRRKVKPHTKIVFMTDHSLLNECLEDPNFGNYSCIIVDEAHERSIYTDILLGMIKACLPNRPDLRVVITSATIDPQVFVDYFQCQKELRVSGRTFPVEVAYMDSVDDFENYESKAVKKAAEIHQQEPAGDILVFLSSPVEIMRCCEEFRRIFQGRKDFQCLPLHGQLQPEDQKKVFDSLDAGVRKVVFATNCAETSITIDGIKYVIDTGVAKEMRYDPKKNLNLLGVHTISQSSADQRKGRAGRTASGKCFRLYSEDAFDDMDVINQPEILRVHLGQAILKLAELGVNVQDYDFVKAPSESALSAAMDTLHYLGAVEDKKITERGRWISKLPFDPQVGYIVSEASSYDLLYDAIVLASVISNGSSLFYRGLTETEAQTSARSKSQYGLESGDIFTWFSIYKTWEVMPRKEKYQWCHDNCINYKCMNFVRQSVDDVINVIKNEMKQTVAKEFSSDDASLKVLSQLVFKANARSICHFLGHSKAGYFSLVTERKVHIHPSSTLAALNLQPQWVVFTELVKTSREFIKGVLAVDEETVQEAVNNGHLQVDLDKAKQQALSQVYVEELGLSAFRSIVGPHCSNLRVLEDACEQYGMKHPIAEADRELGRIAIYSSDPISPEIVSQLKDTKMSTIKKLQAEEKECKIFNPESDDGPNIRAVLGRGGCVQQILMPNQSNQVLIWKVGGKTEEDIMAKFGEYGNILEVIPFKSEEPWGFLRYQTVAEAVLAVEKTEKDEIMSGTLRLEKIANKKMNMFEAKVSWLRRPIKKEGTAFIRCSPMEKPALIGRHVVINGSLREIRLSNKRNNQMEESGQDLVIFKVGNTTEEAIRREITNLLGRAIDMRITIPRERVDAPSQTELEETKRELKSFIDPLNKEEVRLWLGMPKPASCYQYGFLQFKDPVRGFSICRRLNGCIHMNNQIVNIAPSLKTVILVPKRIKEAVEEQLKDLFACMKKDLGVELEWRKLKNNEAIGIKSDSPEGIVKARECITKELRGEEIDCSAGKPCECLMQKSGQSYLKQVQSETGCVIISDLRTQNVHLYGKSANVSKAKIEINKYLTENESKIQKLFPLKGFGKPPGLMKEMMKQFGPLLGGLSKAYDLSFVGIDWKNHTLNCAGSEVGMQKLEGYMSTLEESLQASNARKDTNLPDCVVCMLPVEGKNDMYRLEGCGHAYCLMCFQQQAVVSVQNSQLPLMCAEGTCGSELVWKDFSYILAKKWVTKQKLVNMSLNTCVSTQPNKYKFCPTPNCPVVYQVTLDENGCEFNCAACYASTCTSCHIPFHNGVSCRMAKSVTAAEKDLDEWRKANSQNRKICPTCKSPIEKIEGCNKMCCGSCRTVFCWLCCEVFEDSQKCYAHLMKEHGDIF